MRRTVDTTLYSKNLTLGNGWHCLACYGVDIVLIFIERGPPSIMDICGFPGTDPYRPLIYPLQKSRVGAKRDERSVTDTPRAGVLHAPPEPEALRPEGCRSPASQPHEGGTGRRRAAPNVGSGARVLGKLIKAIGDAAPDRRIKGIGLPLGLRREADCPGHSVSDPSVIPQRSASSSRLVPLGRPAASNRATGIILIVEIH